MLAAKHRLTGRRDYKAVEERGKVFQSQNFGIAYLERGDKNPSRFGFVVSTKISKEAVERNRVKRIIRETVRMSMFEVKEGFDVVFLAKISILRVPTDQVMREVKLALKESGLLK